jgi:hypothetical protein
MIWPDNDVIEFKLKVVFYAACCGGLPQTHVTSPSLANLIYRAEFLNSAKNITFILKPG